MHARVHQDHEPELRLGQDLGDELGDDLALPSVVCCAAAGNDDLLLLGREEELDGLGGVGQEKQDDEGPPDGNDSLNEEYPIVQG